MSSTFSFSRLAKLITKQLFENSRLYIYCVLALFGLLALVFGFWFKVTGPRYDERDTYNIFLLGLYLSGTVFASVSFSMLASKDKGIYWLSVPATHLEKLICTIFYSTIVFTIVYTLIFLLVQTISVSLVQEYIKSIPGGSYTPANVFANGADSIIAYFIYGYFAVQALYLLGSVYFPRYSFIVTSVAGAFIMFVFIYYLSRVHDNLLGHVSWNIVSVRKPDTQNDGYFLYSISPTLADTFKYAIRFAWAPLFWIVTWFRLKEKEI